MNENDKMDIILKEILGMKGEIEAFKGEVSALTNQVSNLTDQVGDFKNQVGDLTNQMGDLKNQVGDLTNQMGALKSEFGDLKKETRGIKLTLENVTNKNIIIIAEGHLDLSRKFDAALQSKNDTEMIKIKLNMIASDVEKLKEGIAS